MIVCFCQPSFPYGNYVISHLRLYTFTISVNDKILAGLKFDISAKESVQQRRLA